MAQIAKIESPARTDAATGETGVEIEALRAELARYRSVFDSARMIIGHEIVRPLTAISGYIELLEGRCEKRADEQERRYFARIREAASQLREIVDSFVQLLMFETGDAQAGERELVDLRAVVEKLRPSFGAMRGRLRNAVGEDIAPVFLRRGLIEVILNNLISNALKYSSDPLPVTVRARLCPERRGAARRGLLQISVEDEGVGICEHEIESIFDPFYRAGDRHAAGGLGLGLSIVKNVVALLEGEIHVRSAPGEGTQITVSIPVPRSTGGKAGKAAGSSS